MEDGRPISAKEKRKEQIKRWENSATDLECETYANPKVRVKFDDGAVFLAACSAGDLDEVKALLENGADIDFANVDGLTALHQACIDGNLEVVQFLVEHGSDIDLEDNEGWTPLHATASCGFMDIAKYLVRKGANVGAVNSEAELPIDIAEEDDMIEYFQNEIDKQGIDVDAARDIERLVMLEDANTLLNTYQNGGKVKFCMHPKSGATPMHITAAKGYNDVLRILIKAGLDVNARDNDGWTPLHAASHWSQEVSAKILADKNADFKARSKLGQTPFDVADEDMLEYLEELETEQEENLKDLVIEPPPIKKDIKLSLPTEDSTDISKTNEIQNGESKNKKNIVDSLESSEGEEIPDPRRSTTRPTPTTDTSDFYEEAKTTPFLNSHALDDSLDLLGQKKESSSSQISSERPRHRPFVTTNREGDTKPIAATRPVQSVGEANEENGVKMPGFISDVEEYAPSSQKTGLRKSDNLDDELNSTSPNLKSSELERSSYSARFTEEKNDDVRMANRVAPIPDANKTPAETETDNASDDTSSGYQWSTSTTVTRRKPDLDNIPTIVTTDTTTDTNTSFKRSSSVTEDTNDNTSNESGAAAKIADAEKRRSHLQPVRDEEAEAQRRIRSRRERQSRRSTQGVTLDVVEEAMRTIGQMKQKQTSGDKQSADPLLDTTKSRNDLSSKLLGGLANSGLQDRPISSQFSLYSGGSPTNGPTAVPTLPSGYIPSDQRVKANGSTESKSAALNVPGITVDASLEGDDDKDDTSTSTDGSNTAAQRKSATQQRRRSRKERRSTGLPDLKPETEKNNEGDEEETAKEDFEKAERLRAKYDSSSLPNRNERHRAAVRNSDSDIPSRITQVQTGDDSSPYSARSRIADAHNYKKLYEENQSENERLRSELTDAQRKISELEARLEKVDESLTRKQTLENEKRERRALERKLADMEQEIQNSVKAEDLCVENSHLKAENKALQRIVEKLGGTSQDVKTQTSGSKVALDDVDGTSALLLSVKTSAVKSGSAPNLRNLEEKPEVKLDDLEPRAHESPGRISTSSSPSLSEDEGFTVGRGAYAAGSYTSRPRADAALPRYTSSRYRHGTTDSATPSYSMGSSYSSLRNKSRLDTISSSPSSFGRSASPRRTHGSSYGGAADYGRSSTFASSRYTGSGKDLSGYSSSGYHTLPGSSSARRDYLRPLPSSSSALSSHRSGSSSFRSTPTTYSSVPPSKTSYSSASTPRNWYSSSVSTSKLTTPLSKYSSGVGSSRRSKKY